MRHGTPPIHLLVIDRALVFDHWKQRLLLVSHAGDYDVAVEGLERLAEDVRTAVPPEPEPVGAETTTLLPSSR